MLSFSCRKRISSAKFVDFNPLHSKSSIIPVSVLISWINHVYYPKSNVMFFHWNLNPVQLVQARRIPVFNFPLSSSSFFNYLFLSLILMQNKRKVPLSPIRAVWLGRRHFKCIAQAYLRKIQLHWSTRISFIAVMRSKRRRKKRRAKKESTIEEKNRERRKKARPKVSIKRSYNHNCKCSTFVSLLFCLFCLVFISFRLSFIHFRFFYRHMYTFSFFPLLLLLSLDLTQAQALFYRLDYLQALR